MAKKHFYTQKLLNTLWKFVNINVNKKSPQYAFTQGIIYGENALFATDRKLLLKATIPDVPKELKGMVCDNEEQYLMDFKEKDINTLETICNNTRTQTFILNIDIWKTLYDKIKNKKPNKSYTEDRISPYECVKLTENLYVKTKDFNKVVKFCDNNNCRLIKFNNNSFSVTSDYLQLVGVNFNIFFDEDEKAETYIYEKEN